MALFCLNKNLTSAFMEKLRSGEIDPHKLSEMSSEERRGFFGEFLGETNARQVNTLFESKMLLKDQQRGIITWAKEVAGLKPPAMRDIISRVNKMTEVLNPETKQAFLEDLAAHKLGTTVTLEEAGQISALAKDVAGKKAAMESGGDRKAYGQARVRFGNYINEIKTPSAKETFMQTVKSPTKIISNTAGTAKAIKASLDDSALFRQGWRTIWTHPNIWAKNAVQSFSDLARTIGGKAVMDEVKADIVSRPNSINGMYEKAKLAVGTIEEAFPAQSPERIPLFGRLYKASETAYTAFLYKTRADIFDKYIDIAQKAKVDLSDPKELTSIGKLVNALTGRGDLGRLEGGGGVQAVNNIFFSPRSVKAHIDTMLSQPLGIGVTKFAQQQAAINLIKIVGGTAAVLATANAIRPGSVVWDPRSSDFGKIKVGDTRFDVTGGMASLVTLASRLLTQSTKSSSTGIVSKLNTGQFGGETGLDVVLNFAENKLSPAASVVKDLLKHQDFNGNPPTLGGEISNLITPLPVTTFLELKNNPRSANIILSMIADGLGVNVNTYSLSKNWLNNTGAELKQFREKVGDAKVKEANKVFNERYSAWFDQVKNNEHFKNLPDADKQTAISNKANALKDQVFRQYHFTYKKPPAHKVKKF